MTTSQANTSMADHLFDPPESRKRERQAPARILEYAPDRRFALPIHTTLEILEEFDIVPVPGAAPHGLGLLLWQERWIPVLDPAVLLGAAEHADTPAYLLVVACQRAPRQPLEYGALALSRLPETVFVGNDSACELPEDSPLWPRISLSCFRHRDTPTPIVDTGRLFGTSHG